jgi:hypothetical protein
VIPSILYSDRNGYKLFPDGEGEFYACYWKRWLIYLRVTNVSTRSM